MPQAQTPPPEYLQKGHSGCAHPMHTHAQKSSTVLNLVTRRRFACHILLLSFLKNQSAHLGTEGKWGVQNARVPLQPPHTHPSAERGCPWPGLPYLFCRGCLPRISAGSSSCCRALCRRRSCCLCRGKWDSPEEPHDRPSREPAAPHTGTPRVGRALCVLQPPQPTGRAPTCSPVAIPSSRRSAGQPLALKYPQAGGVRSFPSCSWWGGRAESWEDGASPALPGEQRDGGSLSRAGSWGMRTGAQSGMGSG